MKKSKDRVRIQTYNGEGRVVNVSLVSSGGMLFSDIW
jgi:hypothetical protein